jgi:hypothetical protein
VWMVRSGPNVEPWSTPTIFVLVRCTFTELSFANIITIMRSHENLG